MRNAEEIRKTARCWLVVSDGWQQDYVHLRWMSATGHEQYKEFVTYTNKSVPSQVVGWAHRLNVPAIGSDDVVLYDPPDLTAERDALRTAGGELADAIATYAALHTQKNVARINAALSAWRVAAGTQEPK